MSERLFINGRFLAQRMTGVQRSARETVLALDRILAQKTVELEATLLLPRNARNDLALEAIRVRRAGLLVGQAWEQLELPFLSAGGFLLSLANLGPLVRRRQGIVIHDAQVWEIPDNFSPLFRSWYRFALPVLGRRARLLMTVSAFSRGELERHRVLDASITEILPNGADHILREPADETVLARHGLEAGRYVLAVGSRNLNKNFALVAAAAPALGRLGLDIAVVGASNPAVFGNEPTPAGVAVRELGYVDDASLRALYGAAVCFAIPSLYEGFGLPAVEAMACGCPVVASRQGALVEVCADAALYCGVDTPDELVERVAALTADPGLRDRQIALGRRRAAAFTWDATAARALSLILRELHGSVPA